MTESTETKKPANTKNDTLNSVSFLDTSRFSNASALDKLSAMLSRHMRLDQIGDLKGNVPTIPINDLRGNDATLYSREERVLRCQLASLYRLLDLYAWTQSIYNHISVRCAKHDHFLINPFGLLYHEVQASSLVKIDSDGNIIDPGSTLLGINRAGWTLHSALHAHSPDINCVVHVHLPDVIAVSCLKAGLLPVCPEAIELISQAGIRYHDYQGLLVDDKERKSIQTDLGKEAKVMFLRNHGVVVAAKNVVEAWYLLKRVITACQIQIRLLQQGGSTYLKTVAQSLEKIATNGHANGVQSNGHHQEKKQRRPFDAPQNGDTNGHNADEAQSVKSDDQQDWTPMEKEFEAQMRILDSAGFVTGHQYRQPNLLRRGHYGPLADDLGTMSKMGPGGMTWGGDSTMHGAGTLDMLSDRTSAAGGDLSGAEDYVASATAAGQAHLAKINESVRAQKQKSGAQRNGTVGGDNSLYNTMDSSLHWDVNQTLYDPAVIKPKHQNSFLNDSEIAYTPMRASSPMKPKNGVQETDRTASLPHGTKSPGKIHRFGSFRGFSFRRLNRKPSLESPSDGQAARSSKTIQVSSSPEAKGAKKDKKSKPARSFRSVFGGSKKEEVA